MDRDREAERRIKEADLPGDPDEPRTPPPRERPEERRPDRDEPRERPPERRDNE